MGGKFKKGDPPKGAAKVRKSGSDEEKAALNKAISNGITKSIESKRAEIQVYDSIRTSLIDSGDYSKFLTTFINKAKKDPDSASGRKLADIILNSETIKSLDASYDKIMARDQDFLQYRIAKHFFKEQLIVLQDNVSRKVFLGGGRRSGKTQVISGKITQQLAVNNSRIVYIHRNATSSIRQMFDLVVNLSNNVELGLSSTSKSNGTIEANNNSHIIFMGNSDINSFDRLRGEHFDLIIIDECSFQRNLKMGILEVIEPTMLDKANSKLILSSTPPRAPGHYAELLWNSQEFKKYHWNFWDNPIIPNKEEFIKKLCEEKKLTPDSPFVRREYYGDWGVYDTEAQVYKDRTYHDELPTFPIDEVIFGVDFGFQDDNAIIGLAYSRSLKKGYIFYEDVFHQVGAIETGERARKAFEEAKLLANKHNIPHDRIVFYYDYSHKQTAYDMNHSYGLRALNCYKYDKIEAINQLSDFFRIGSITMKKDGPLDKECEQILWKRDDNTDAIIPEIDEEAGIHGNATDAILYASRTFSYHIGLITGGLSAEAKQAGVR